MNISWCIIFFFFFFAFLVAQQYGICLQIQEIRVRPLGREDPLEEGLASHSSIAAGESHGRRSLAGYSPWDRKESDMTY